MTYLECCESLMAVTKWEGVEGSILLAIACYANKRITIPQTKRFEYYLEKMLV